MPEWQKQVPNVLSLSRVPGAVIFLLLYSDTRPAAFIAAMVIATIAIVTDFLDGILARRWCVSSDLGYFLDGLGDKAFYFAVLLVMMREHATNDVLVWLLIAREVFLYALRSIDEHRADNMKRLRQLSRYYALFIRLYFLAFVVHDGLRIWGIAVPNVLNYSDAFGYIAVALGYASITALMRNIAQRA